MGAPQLLPQVVDNAAVLLLLPRQLRLQQGSLFSSFIGVSSFDRLLLDNTGYLVFGLFHLCLESIYQLIVVLAFAQKKLDLRPQVFVVVLQNLEPRFVAVKLFLNDRHFIHCGFMLRTQPVVLLSAGLLYLLYFQRLPIEHRRLGGAAATSYCTLIVGIQSGCFFQVTHFGLQKGDLLRPAPPTALLVQHTFQRHILSNLLL
mmetsp:Transcript_24584/g.48396  ORF Transcript_24584/g.48396 Transcript_24584/m.48396 type:complete len:202 (+) Transcript_24584:860-1465(+)